MSRTKKELLLHIDGYSKAKFVAPNTLEIHYNDGTRAIRLHDTDILTFKDNEVVYNCGNWQTVTTKDRMNRFGNLNVYQVNSQWFIGKNWQERSEKDESLVYYDGITFDLEGNLISEKKVNPEHEIKKMKRRIAKYVKLITKDNLPIPNSGDCWFCLLHDKDGNTMGELGSNPDHEHLLNHLDESYLHGSILVNAMREKGFHDQQIGLHYSMKLHETFQRAVRQYLNKRLLKDLILAK